MGLAALQTKELDEKILSFLGFHDDPISRCYIFVFNLFLSWTGGPGWTSIDKPSGKTEWRKGQSILRTSFWWWTSYPESCRNSASIFTSEISSVLMFVSPEPASHHKHLNYNTRHGPSPPRAVTGQHKGHQKPFLGSKCNENRWMIFSQKNHTLYM